MKLNLSRLKQFLAKLNTAKSKSVIAITLGFVLIFAILTSMILYTVYERSLIDFIQGIGREKEKPQEEVEEPVNPALLTEGTADQSFTDGLWILSDSVIANTMNLEISVKNRCYATSFISTTNYMEAVFSGIQDPESCLTIKEFVSTNKPKYLLINFSETGLTLEKNAVETLYKAIVNLILNNSPETTVILSGPLPLAGAEDIPAKTIITLDSILAELAGKLNNNGQKVYYLPSPTSFFDENQLLKSEYTDKNGILNNRGCGVYFNNYILRHPVPADNE